MEPVFVLVRMPVQMFGGGLEDCGIGRAHHQGRQLEARQFQDEFVFRRQGGGQIQRGHADIPTERGGDSGFR